MSQPIVTVSSPLWAPWASAPHASSLPYVDILLTQLGLAKSLCQELSEWIFSSPWSPLECVRVPLSTLTLFPMWKFCTSLLDCYTLYQALLCKNTLITYFAFQPPSIGARPVMQLSSQPCLGSQCLTLSQPSSWIALLSLHWSVTVLQAALFTMCRLRHQTTTPCGQTTLLFQMDSDIPLWNFSLPCFVSDLNIFSFLTVSHIMLFLDDRAVRHLTPAT